MNWQTARALVTGGAGFIPSHIVDALVARGAQVIALDNLQAGKKENLSEALPRITFVEGDVRDAGLVDELADGQDVIFHLAANASVPNSIEDPRYDFETNAVGTLNVLEAARRHGVKKVIFACSAAVYGEPRYVPMDERHVLDPVSFYGVSKQAGERLGMMFHRMFGVGFVSIRIFNTYGPRQPRYVMADLLRKLRANPNELEVLGDGTQVRDYCYVTDTAAAFLHAAENDSMVGEAYNVAGGNPISIKDLVALMLRVLDLPNTRIRYTGQSWKGDITKLMADISKIRLTGFSPQVGLEDGIRRMVEWFRAVEG